MIVYTTKLERFAKSKLEAIYDVEDYEGIKVRQYHKYIYNLNRNRLYRLDYKDKVLFWVNNRIKTASELDL